MSSTEIFLGFVNVDGSSNAILDNLSTSKSFSLITSDNLWGMLNLSLKSKTQSTNPLNDLFFNSKKSLIFIILFSISFLFKI